MENCRMARINLTATPRREYMRLYNTCEILETRFDDVDAIADSVLDQSSRYEAVAGPLDIP